MFHIMLKNKNTQTDKGHSQSFTLLGWGRGGGGEIPANYFLCMPYKPYILYVYIFSY